MMKTRFCIILLISAFFVTAGCRSKPSVNADQGISQIKFTETVYDYGNIDFGSDGKCEFTFVNTSKQPLIINNVRASCGCTSPEWPKDPLQPGEKGVISIKYNTTITGSFRKSITVYSNTEDSPINLFVKGNVLTTTSIK